MPDSKCFMCARQVEMAGDPPVKDEQWKLFDLKLISAWFSNLCKHHKDYCEKRIPELEKLEPKKKVLLTGDAIQKYEPKRFLPPIIEAPKNFHEKERPANDGSLIE